jgi:hypothetical protein
MVTVTTNTRANLREETIGRGNYNFDNNTVIIIVTVTTNTRANLREETIGRGNYNFRER